MRWQSNQEPQVDIPGIWSLINVTLSFIKRPVHPGIQISVDSIFTADLGVFFGILALIRDCILLRWIPIGLGEGNHRGCFVTYGCQWVSVMRRLNI